MNSQLPPQRRRIDSSDEEEPERSVWPPQRPYLEFDDENYTQEDVKLEEPRRRKQLRRSANRFLDAEAGVDGDASDDEHDVDENCDYDLDGFIVADDVEY